MELPKVAYIFAARKDVAVDMYKKGILELEKGIAVDVSGEGKAISMANFSQSMIWVYLFIKVIQSSYNLE